MEKEEVESFFDKKKLSIYLAILRIGMIKNVLYYEASSL